MALNGKDKTLSIGFKTKTIIVRETPAIIYAETPPVICTPDKIRVVIKREDV